MNKGATVLVLAHEMDCGRCDYVDDRLEENGTFFKKYVILLITPCEHNYHTSIINYNVHLNSAAQCM